jgi:3'-phosphoadenosine 5'-phosphosulfate sulfotransferase (PAPS reductase)/FAD synthetase
MTAQLPLFEFVEALPQLPDPVEMLREGAALVLSVSGGKDSDAMTHHLLRQRAAEGWSGAAYLVHADLGRAEWHNTTEYIHDLAQRTSVPLHIVRWTHGDLIDRIWARYHADPTRPCWPSAAVRYCTSDLKRGPISRWIRATFPTGNVVCAMGLRAEESPARSKKAVVSIREDCTAPTRRRLTLNWLPIHEWKVSDVWHCIEAHGDICHPAYRLENERLSCACCVLGSVNDLLNGAIHNPETYCELCRIEAVTGYSFRKGFWLSDLQPDLLPPETLAAVHQYRRKEQA